MRVTVEAIYEAGVFKSLEPLPDLQEHTKVRITVEAIVGTDGGTSVIDEQRKNRLHLDPQVARDIGDGDE
jgi:predicted DNA-binding antitoxin AbrB/MazE fold protein